MNHVLRRFLAEREGSVAILFALLVVPLAIVIGAGIDYTRAAAMRSTLQNAADAAALAAAIDAGQSTPAHALQDKVDAFLAANSYHDVTSKGPPKLDAERGELCVAVTRVMETSLLRLANITSIPVGATACASLSQGEKTLEVALVLDVSKSMIENNLMAPMQTAVTKFLNEFSSNAAFKDKTRISIVPYSSRVNVGMTHTSWLKAYNGNSAVPDRWINPMAHYNNATHTLSYWIDGVTPRVYHAGNQNYYWMGCVEPRADVEVNDSSHIGPHGLGDATPWTSRFVPMDSNPGSGKSFCPPPIVPLSSNFAKLNNAVGNLTPQGSTRLDTGLIGGWYTLSPKWQGVWGAASAPADYAPTVQKTIVFMTDGRMNTQRGQNAQHVDWLCKNNMSPYCNTMANERLVEICTAVKLNDIEIYSISYDDEADTQYLQACASSDDHFFMATKTSISSVYEQIAKRIARKQTHLTQ